MAERVNALLTEAANARGQMQLMRTPPPTINCARVYSSVPVEIPSSNTWLPIPFSTARYDTGGWFNSATPQWVTVPAPGLLRVHGQVHYPALSGGDRRLAIQIDGVVVAFDIRAGDGGRDTSLHVSTEIMVYTGQIVKLLANQNSGAPLSLRLYPSFSPELSVSVSP